MKWRLACQRRQKKGVSEKVNGIGCHKSAFTRHVFIGIPPDSHRGRSSSYSNNFKGHTESFAAQRLRVNPPAITVALHVDQVISVGLQVSDNKIKLICMYSIVSVPNLQPGEIDIL